MPDTRKWFQVIFLPKLLFVWPSNIPGGVQKTWPLVLTGHELVMRFCSSVISEKVSTPALPDSWGWCDFKRDTTSLRYRRFLQSLHILRELQVCFFNGLTDFTFWEGYFFTFLAVPRSMWDFSSPRRDQTCAPCIGSTESKPLDHQGSPWFYF